MRLTLFSALIVFLLDQVSKYVVLFQLDLPARQVINVASPYLTFRMAWNEGINFGLFGDFDLRWILVGIAIAVSAFVLWWINREKPNRWGLIGAGLLVGGALGNAIDRVVYGAVADFINMSCCGINNPYAFNIADVAIFVGAVGLVLFGAEKKTA